MANVRLLPSGKWNVQIRKAGSKPISSTHPTKEAAEQWAAEQERVLFGVSQSVHELAETYLNEVMIVKGKKRGGYEAIYYKLRNVADFLSLRPLESLSGEDVATYRNARLKAVAGSTVRLELQLMSRFLRWMKSEKGINCNDVVEGVKLPDPGKARTTIIEPLQFEMILSNASEKAQPVIYLAWHTAMRRNEILAITPAMVDFPKRVIHLSDDQTKNGEGRDVPLNSAALALLRDLCNGKDANAPLFTLTPYAVSQAFRRAARISLVKNVCFHSLRHSAITRYAEKGLNTLQLQAISGHKSITMLARYSHIKATSVADLMD